MSESAARQEVGGTGRFTMNLTAEDGTRVGAANIQAATVTLKNAATGAVINSKNALALTSGSTVTHADFSITDDTDADGVLITIFGWDIQAADLAHEAASNLLTREQHWAEFIVTFTQGSETKILRHIHRLTCVDVPSICTVTQLEDQFGAQIADGQRRLFEAAIEATAAQAERYTKRKLRVNVAQETIRLSAALGQRVVQLPRYPLGTIDEVKTAFNGDHDNTTAVVAETEYYADTERGTIERLNVAWLHGPGTVRVKHTGSGLFRDVGAVPGDLAFMAARNAKWLIDRKDSLGISSEAMEGATVASFVTGGMLPEFKEVLRELRTKAATL